MTSHTGRLYAAALALIVFFLAWAVIAAHPWAAPAHDARLAALQLREAQLRREAKLVNEIVALRRRTASRRAAAAAPPVRIVTLPPLTVTRTS